MKNGNAIWYQNKNLFWLYTTPALWAYSIIKTKIKRGGTEMLYNRNLGIYVSNVKPDAYEVNGHKRTLKELHDEWEASKEWGYTTETFDTWKERLTRQGVIKAVFNYRKR